MFLCTTFYPLDKMYHSFKEPGRLGVIERVSEMISEKESYEEIVTGGIYNETTITDQIHTKWAGKTVHFARETDSTNLWIKRLAKEGAPEGTLALAEFQSAGRGRLGRSWEVPEGTSVMMSILLRPKFEPQYAPMLTLVMGMAVAKAVKKLGFDVSIKWPNDVVVSHKKICGILTEMGVRDGKIDYAVIGVGINVNIREFPEEMADKATSLYLESGREFDRSQIPGLVMEAFEEYYEKFAATCDLSGLKEEYESILANYNQPVRVLAKEPYEGVARGITDGGELLVEKTDGTIVAVSAGEVSVRGLYSYV
jgi:BirA family biotin operon repressor/biotin-[acetyl-CoA-carboxylase] ligase